VNGLSRVTLLAALALSAASPALAQRIAPMKAGKLLQLCSRPNTAEVCDAYISGVSDGGTLAKLNAKNEGDTGAGAGFCIAPAVTIQDMRTKVGGWMKSHSDALTKPAGEAVFAALHDSYPCGSGK
jgi:hypothetical protein